MNPEAAKMLMNYPNPEDVLSKILNYLDNYERKVLVITPEIISNALKPRLVESDKRESIEVVFTFREFSESIKDVAEAYRSLFLDRYNKLSSILKSRPGLMDLGSEGGSDVHIGLVRKVVKRRDYIKILVEDPYKSIVGVVKRDSKAYESAMEVSEDEVIAIKGRLKDKNMMYVSEIVWPDVPMKIQKFKEGSGGLIGFISDLHVGSRYFSEDRFYKLIDALKGSSRFPDVFSRVKYLIVAGDLVDGIGIYPNQINELKIMDIYEQYELVGEILSEVPRRVKIIIIPGNHDASGIAIPSPPIFKDIAEPLYKLPNVMMLGDPTLLRIEGRLILISHGRNLEDAIPNYSRRGYTSEGVVDAMKALLIRRLLVTTYGQTTPIAPTVKDFFTITSVPDVIHMGHIHIAANLRYKGIYLLNSGTWSEQTSYQRALGIEPTIGSIYILDPSSMTLSKAIFTSS